MELVVRSQTWCRAFTLIPNAGSGSGLSANDFSSPGSAMKSGLRTSMTTRFSPPVSTTARSSSTDAKATGSGGGEASAPVVGGDEEDDDMMKAATVAGTIDTSCEDELFR